MGYKKGQTILQELFLKTKTASKMAVIFHYCRNFATLEVRIAMDVTPRLGGQIITLRHYPPPILLDSCDEL